MSEARLGISAAFTDQHLIIGSALDRGYCPVNNWNLAHKGAVNIFQMVLEEADCDGDGSPDVCDAMPDCNGNGLPDSCDLQTKFSADCNGNALPDECDAIPLYQYDDEDCPGFFGDLLTPLSDLIWLNQFRVRPGGQMVTHIVLPTSAYVPEGAPVTLLLYSDPNHDGDPSDARLLRAVDSVRIGFPEQQSRYWQTVRVPIEPTFVGEPGEFFFVGAIARQPVAALYDWDWLPAFVSTSGPLKRSWIAAARFGEGDINHLANNEMPVQRIPSGVFFLRALAMDCNQNGVWDHCDIASGTSVDANHNDLPDECEGPDCLADAFPSAGDGLVDTSDLLYVIDHWGACLPCYAMCAGDINDDCAVNVIDLLAVINAWGACR